MRKLFNKKFISSALVAILTLHGNALSNDKISDEFFNKTHVNVRECYENANVLSKEEIAKLVKKGEKICSDIVNDEYNYKRFHVQNETNGPSIFTDKKINAVANDLGHWSIPRLKSVRNFISYYTNYDSYKEDEKRRVIRNLRLEDVLSVTWFIAHHNYINKNDFKRGSISFIDHDQKLYKFLSNYAVFAAEVENRKELPALANWRLVSKTLYPPFTYDRNPNDGFSSHYKNAENQMGIDFKFNIQGFGLPVGPYGTKTLLIGSVQEKNITKTFFKWENEGLGTSSETVSHGADFFGGGVLNQESKREKDFPKGFVTMYNNFIKAQHSKGKLLLCDVLKSDKTDYENSVAVLVGNIMEKSEDDFKESELYDLLKDVLNVDDSNFNEHIKYLRGNEVVIDFDSIVK